MQTLMSAQNNMVSNLGLNQQQQMGPEQPQSPFDDGGQGGGGYMPNIPMPIDNSQMLRELIGNNDYGDDKLQEFDWVFNRDNVLGFVDEDRKAAMMLSFDILAIDALNAMPYRAFNWETTKKWGAVRHIFESKTNRAMGFKHNERMNERIGQITQMQETRQVMRDDTGNNGQRDGFIRRLLGKR